MAKIIQALLPCFDRERFRCGRCLLARWWAVMALLIVSAAVTPAAAQDWRERTTNLLEEAEERLVEETDEAEKQRLRRKIEYYRHGLGYRDHHGRKLLWQVSYQKRLLKPLDQEIARMESMTKGGWGLASKSDDCKRAVRIIARNLLQRSDREQDENERHRYGFGGMLLVHNADVIDALLVELPKVQEARKAKGDAQDRGTRTLDRGLGAANGLVDMARRIADGKMQMGHGELGRLCANLGQISAAADHARTGKLPALPPDPKEAQKKVAAEIDDLRQRASALGDAQA
jgi:hypothetical protein